MKYLKTLNLAAVAAMSLMALLGASSASATVLCNASNTTSNCSKNGGDYPATSEIHATLKPGTKAVLNASGIINECSESTLVGKTTNTGGSTSTVDGFIKWEPTASPPTEDLTWGGCTAEVTRTVKGGVMEIHWIPGTDNGTVTVREVEVTVKTAGLSCTYGAGTGIDLGTLTGGNPAVLSISTNVFPSGGFLCPRKKEEVTWTAEYVITKPTQLWVSEQ